METDELLILIGGTTLFVRFVVYEKMLRYWNGGPSFTEEVAHFLDFLGVRIFLLILVFFVLVLIYVYLHRLCAKKSLKKEERDMIRHEETRKTRRLLKKDPDYLESDEVENLIDELTGLDVLEEVKTKYSDEIEAKLKSAKEELLKKKRDEELDAFYTQKRELQERVEEIKKRVYEESLKLRDKKEAILNKLRANENTVYESKKLRPEEIKVLKEEGFKEVNEYDPIKEKNVNFFVKKVLNHSYTHTFLVGRIKELILEYLEAENIRIHDTKDADLTFKVGQRVYAFEIETGNLLKKKKQMKQKISSLNNKYGQNWYFVVSNKNLLSEYKIYGPSIPRARVRKMVEKLAQT